MEEGLRGFRPFPCSDSFQAAYTVPWAFAWGEEPVQDRLCRVGMMEHRAGCRQGIVPISGATAGRHPRPGPQRAGRTPNAQGENQDMLSTHQGPGAGRASFRSIVVATDLSDGSDEVVRAAGEVAARSAAPLHVVHAIDAPAGAGNAREEQVREAERLVDALISREVPSEVAVQRHVEGSPPERAIMEWADRADSGLIVVGPHVRRAGPAHHGENRLKPFALAHFRIRSSPRWAEIKLYAQLE